MTFVAELLYRNILTQAAKAPVEIRRKYNKLSELYLLVMNEKSLPRSPFFHPRECCEPQYNDPKDNDYSFLCSRNKSDNSSSKSALEFLSAPGICWPLLSFLSDLHIRISFRDIVQAGPNARQV